MSKNAEKRLCEYIHILEELIKNIMDNTEKKNYEINKRIDKLKNILAKNGITPEEIENALSIKEPYDPNLELLKNEVINENVPDLNSLDIFPQNYKEHIEDIFRQNHLQLEAKGIYLNEEQK